MQNVQVHPQMRVISGVPQNIVHVQRQSQQAIPHQIIPQPISYSFQGVVPQQKGMIQVNPHHVVIGGPGIAPGTRYLQ